MDEIMQAKIDEKIKDILALAKKKKSTLDYTEIMDFFADLGLEDEQLDKVVESLEANGVDVLKMTEEDDVDEEKCFFKKKLGAQGKVGDSFGV